MKQTSPLEHKVLVVTKAQSSRKLKHCHHIFILNVTFMSSLNICLSIINLVHDRPAVNSTQSDLDNRMCAPSVRVSAIESVNVMVTPRKDVHFLSWITHSIIVSLLIFASCNQLNSSSFNIDRTNGCPQSETLNPMQCASVYVTFLHCKAESHAASLKTRFSRFCLTFVPQHSLLLFPITPSCTILLSRPEESIDPVLELNKLNNHWC